VPVGNLPTKFSFISYILYCNRPSREFCGMTACNNHRYIENKVTGQRIIFVRTAEETNGELLEMEAVYAPLSEEPPLHYHAYQWEHFSVSEGELTIRMNGEIQTYGKGSVVSVPSGERHSMWNAGHIPARVIWRVIPALKTQEFLVTLSELANNGKTNKKGVPSLPRMVSLLLKYKASFRLHRPPIWILYILFFACAPLSIFKRYQ